MSQRYKKDLIFGYAFGLHSHCLCRRQAAPQQSSSKLGYAFGLRSH